MNRQSVFTVIYFVILVGGAVLSAAGYGDFRPDADLITLAGTLASVAYAAVSWYLHRQTDHTLHETEAAYGELTEQNRSLRRDLATARSLTRGLEKQRERRAHDPDPPDAA